MGMDTMNDLRKMQKEAEKLRRKELLENYNKLSAESQIQVVMLSRKLLEKEWSDRQLEAILREFRKLDDKEKQDYLRYIETLSQDPRYRRMDYEEA